MYPPLARTAAVQGTVVLDAAVSKTGDVTELKLISGAAMLAPAAIDAVKQWKYKPYLVNGVAFDITTEVAVIFQLDPRPGEAGVNGGEQAGAAKVSPVSRMRVSSGVTAGLLLRRVDPVYPQEAKDAHIQGTVILHAIISREGSIEGLTVVTGPAELAGAAMDAVKQWKYKPYLFNGEPIELDTTIEVRYQLSR